MTDKKEKTRDEKIDHLVDVLLKDRDFSGWSRGELRECLIRFFEHKGWSWDD